MRLPLTVKWSYLYFGFRVAFLATALIFSVLWIIYGFDSTIEQIFFPEEAGLGVHLSTYQTLSLIIYVSLINFHVDGLKNIKQLIREIKLDFKAFIHPLIIRKLQSERKYAVEPLRALICSGCLALICLFIFEIPYVFFLNYYHFGDWFFPVYMFETDFLSPVFYRNIILLVLPLIFFIWALFYPTITKGWKIKYRLNLKAFNLLLIMVACWLAWISFDSSHEPESPESLGLDLSKNWTFPTQERFPQNTYIYFDIPLNTYYVRENLFGWHQDDWQVHLLNIWTKYMVFLSVGYIFQVKIKNV